MRRIGRFGRSKGQPLQTYQEVFGHPFDEDADLKENMNHDEHDDDIYYTSGYTFLLDAVAEERFKGDHVCTIAATTLEMMEAAVKLAYPYEGCGMVIGGAGCIDHDEVFAVKNVNRYRRAAYIMDPLQQVGILNMAEQRGLKLRIIFHSHPEMSAFFSSIDRAEATSTDPGAPDWDESVVYIVMGIRRVSTVHADPSHPAKWPIETRAYLWNPAITDFSEITLKVVE